MAKETVTKTAAQEESHVDVKVAEADMSLKTLRDAIPDYCFQPNLTLSFYYLFRDLLYCSILGCALWCALQTDLVRKNSAVYYATVNIYGVAQGIVFTGIWVLAHDAGHGGFSKNQSLADGIGYVLHSALLAPYFSWKSTHHRHHRYANHMTKDLNYVPPLRDEYARRLGVAIEKLEDVGQDAPIVLLLRIILQQLIGWNWYIISNITCPPTAVVKSGMSAWRHSHFDPYGAMFRDEEAIAVLLSDIGCGATLAALYAWYQYTGSFATVFWAYVVPWCWCNHWVVMITFLHHTHPDLPKYTPESWTFVKGAIATMDRDFGFVGRHFFHHISSDHVTHHLFPRIPHYYSPVATKAIKPLLGSEYRSSPTFNFHDLQVAFSQCQWVEPGRPDARLIKETSEGQLYYRMGKSPYPEYRMRSAKLWPGMAVKEAR